MPTGRQALDFLRLCFTAPTVVLNQIMVEAYKKYMLISLIQHGEVQSVHKAHNYIKKSAARFDASS